MGGVVPSSNDKILMWQCPSDPRYSVWKILHRVSQNYSNFFVSGPKYTRLYCGVSVVFNALCWLILFHSEVIRHQVRSIQNRIQNFCVCRPQILLGGAQFLKSHLLPNMWKVPGQLVEEPPRITCWKRRKKSQQQAAIKMAIINKYKQGIYIQESRDF